MGGYDKRSRATQRRTVSQHPVLGDQGTATSHPVAAKAEEVTSYRSEPRGQLVLEKDIDAYAWFLSANSRTKRENALRNSALGSRGLHVMDNGHAFRHASHQTYNTLSGTRNYFYGNSSVQRVGGPICVTGVQFNDQGFAKQLFYYAASGTPRTIVSPKAFLPEWDHKYYGSQAISKAAPTRPKVNIAVTLAELLREGLPNGIVNGTFRSLVKSNKALFTKSGWTKDVTVGQAIRENIRPVGGAGEDYLNFWFAVYPLLSDLVRLSDVFNDISNILTNYQGNAGKGVRRSRILKNSTKSVVFDPTDINMSNVGIGTLPAAFPASYSLVSSSADNAAPALKDLSVTVSQLLSERISFSGSFTYYIPGTDALLGNLPRYKALLDHLLGAPMSVQALWELAPWSWFVDWFFDVQSAIASAELANDDNLVMNYGYLMREAKAVTLLKAEFDWSRPARTGSFRSASTSHTSVLKERVRANPFGFSFKDPGELSFHQWSLLAAIGVSGLS